MISVRHGEHDHKVDIAYGRRVGASCEVLREEIREISLRDGVGFFRIVGSAGRSAAIGIDSDRPFIAGGDGRPDDK